MKFLLTRELGRLSRWLRILGFDARYEPSGSKAFCMLEALKEERVVVTRNMRFGRRHGGSVVFLHANDLKGQILELQGQLGLAVDRSLFFSRCILCNEPLAAIPKAVVEKEVPPYVFETVDVFRRCPACRRVYWKGTHWENVEEIITSLLCAA
ncbi:hypothetical protein BU251_08305 [Candidatus Velamenicoccus archaeovorus]|uniref:Mut7-C RNAse domain-containing protein n=1 Tax=Velamenicoccus archaeovorus TaxID=1930593 RepID=A0A410P6D4_VELA1|nr:Mut7-C RNAse domain-containing protein [Candidatus Velamenicoccus archaeovorus]QAT17720.1 hypothetical protein BU251_08305 [Candidatus Velamenicoccus archaeovorus]